MQKSGRYLSNPTGIFLPQLGDAKLLPLGLLVWLGIAGSIWLGQATIAPEQVQAYTARVDVALDRLTSEPYEILVRRAEAAARAAAQRSFDRDILVTEVSIVVVAESDGSSAPLLTLDVSRAQWRSRPDPQRWAKYFRSTRTLLDFDGDLSGAKNPRQPAVQMTPTTAPAIPTTPTTSPNQTISPTPSQPSLPVAPTQPSSDDSLPPQLVVPSIPRQRG